MFNFSRLSRIFIYCRVSSSKQRENLGVQYDCCRNWVKNNFNENLTTIYYNDIKSTYNKKDALIGQKTMEKKVGENDLIVIRDISRLGRNEFQCLSFLEKIKNKNAYIYSVNDDVYYNLTPFGNNYFVKKIADSRLYSEYLSINTKNKLNGIRKRGGYIGRPPFGYLLSRNNLIPILVENLHEKKIIKLICTCKNEKNYNFNKIAAFLNNKRLYNKSKLWTENTVKRIYYKTIKKNMNELSNNLTNINDSDNLTNNNDVNNLTNNNYSDKDEKTNNIELRSRRVCRIQ